MEFYLVRHGEAVSEIHGPERPLTQAGRQGVEQVAQAAAGKNVHVCAVFHSGVLRAKQTAEILADYLQPTLGARTLRGLLPEDDPLIAKAELESARQPILLVGHLPHMNRLAALLVGGNVERAVVNFTPGMIVCVTYENSRWDLAWHLAPQVA